MHADTGPSERFSEAWNLSGDDIADRDDVTRPGAVGGHEQVDCGYAAFIDRAFPPIAAHLPVADRLDRCHYVGALQHVWRDTEVSITGGPQRQVEPETLNVEHHRDSADQPIFLGDPSRGERASDIVDRGEAAVGRGREAWEHDR